MQSPNSEKINQINEFESAPEAIINAIETLHIT